MNRDDIRSGMQVLGSDGGMIGVVDGIDGSDIRVREGSEAAARHMVPLAWVSRVDDHVHLDRSAALARDTWDGAAALGGAAVVEGSAPRTAATDLPVRRSLWVWIIGAALLLMVLFLLARGCAYAGRDANYEDNAKGELSQDERESSGASAAADSGVAVTSGTLSQQVDAYLGGSEPAGRSFAFQQLEFDTGSAVIRSRYGQEVADLATLLVNRPAARVRIVGYADARGAAGANQDLGAARAQAVAAALTTNGVAADRIETASGGEAAPAATNATAQGQQRNRRTEVVILAR